VGADISTDPAARSDRFDPVTDDPRQWRAVFEAVAARSRDAIVVSATAHDDPVERIQFVNQAFADLTGFGVDEACGASTDLLGGEAELASAMADIETGASVTTELTLVHKNGSQFVTRAVLQQVLDASDPARPITWHIATYQGHADVTAAVAAASSREEWAQAIVSAVSDIIIVTDETTKILWISPSVSRLGYEPEELVGTLGMELVHPDDVASAAETIGRVITHEFDFVPSVYRIRDGAGEWRYLSLNGANQLEHSAIGGIILSATDVTERTLIEEGYRARERWAHALVQGGSDLVLVTDRAGVLTYASPAVSRILGYEPEEVIGTSPADVLDPDDVEEARRVFALVGSDAEGGQSHEFRVRHRNGSWRILNAVMTDMHDDPAVGGLVINVRDVTSRRVVEDLLSEQADLLEAIARGAPLEVTLQKITQMIEHVIDGASCAIGILDPDGAIRVRAAASLPRQIVSLLDTLPPDSDAGIDLRRSGGEALTYPLDRPSPLGAPDLFVAHGYTLCRKAPVLAPGSGELLGSLSVFHPVDTRLSKLEADLLDRALNMAAIAIERRRFESTLEYQALYDPLTGLPNRTLLHSRIQDALTRSERLDTGVAVLFIDLDRFKVINDSVGHALGDQLLREVTSRFQIPLRPGDTLGRFGGDEFMVVCSRIADEEAAAEAARRFMEQLREPVRIDESEIFVTASIGIAFADDESISTESLVRNADVAMYRAKDQGRNQYVVFQQKLDQQAVEQLAMEQAIRQAIDREEFELFFQPVVRLADGAMTHVEALVRWERPGHGMVFPNDFIPLAEETGLIVPLGWWILEEACRRAASWPELPGGELVEVAVNLSAKQLASPDLLPTVEAVLQRTGVSADRLCFEVTESALVRDVDQAIEALLAIKSLGVKVAIDDFGTGYASLDYVRHFSMADYLKIDRSFVEGVEKEGSQEAAIVTAAIALARSLNLTVIAEGVETLFQMEALRDLECELAQGYLFSRPVPVDVAMELLAGG
jgi:diguanylate cyclase (GGDEF)-like protein/PAS domain S-box-containing protein